RQVHPGQRYYKRLSFRLGNEVAIHEAKGGPGADRQKEGAPDVLRAGLEQRGAGHGDKAADGADGNIDTGTENDNAHRKGNDKERRVEVEKVKEGMKLPETTGKTEQGNAIHQEKDNPGDDKKTRPIRHSCSWFGRIQGSHSTP